MIGIEDPDLEPFPAQELGELDVWALAEVVGLRLEAQTEQRDDAFARVEDASRRRAKVRLVAPHDPVQHRQVDVCHPREVHQGAQVLRQT